MASTICDVPDGYPPEIIGYADPWIVSPGDKVAIKVSSTAAEFSHRTVRLIQGLDVPESPPVQVETIAEIQGGLVKGRFQKANPGSYAVVENVGFGAADGGVEVSLYALPTRVDAGHNQTLFSLLGSDFTKGVAIVVGSDGNLVLQTGSADHLNESKVGYQLIQDQWVKIRLQIRQASADISVEPITYLGQRRGDFYQQTITLGQPLELSTPGRLTVAATAPSTVIKPYDFFNGRIGGVSIIAISPAGPRDAVRLDFSLNMSSDKIFDVSGHGRHGFLVNAPARAVRGHDWDGSETDWTKASYGYGAIHFHEDDLDDAKWDTDFEIVIPQGARSGAFAVEVQHASDPSVHDSITFFVRPGPASEAKLALVLSTFTYTAYANEHMYDQSKSSQLALIGQKTPRSDEDFARMKRRSDLGLSLYDVHSDGSGSVFSTTKRPILNVRPWFQHWAFDRPREFSADLLMIGFLERLGIPYDVLTDHDLHSDGVDAIKRYNTVVTGSHPEYPTLQSLNAYSNFAARGGNICYLGGNGFYWLSVLDPKNPHRLEVRRGDQGVRTFGLPGGERHHSLNGAQGGLWRSRGRAANYLFGIGCCGEGIGPGVPYSRAEAVRHQSNVEATTARERYTWVFEGLGPDELIGEHGFGGGASGDEIDRWDPAHGSSKEAVVLASSTGHSDVFGLFPEDYGFQEIAMLGSQTSKIRSDIIMQETTGGGSVFSVGSMNWYCSLGWSGYNNSVARVTENVIRRFVGLTK